MPSLVWPEEDVRDIRTSAALRDIKNQMASHQRDQEERQQMLASPPSAPEQPSGKASWDFSSMLPSLTPWNQQEAPAAAPQQMQTGQPADPWDFSSLLPSLTPWQPKPAVMPISPQTRTVNGSVTMTAGQQVTGDSMQLGDGLGSVSFGAPSGPPSEGVQRWSSVVDEAARQYGVPREVIMGIMDIESGGNPDAVSAAGAMGLMQVMPFHYSEGENGMDPRTSIMRGAKILADNYRRWGDWDRAAAAYFGAIDENGRITDASDATGTTGSNYVRLFRGAASKYASGAVPLPDVPNQNPGMPPPVPMPDVPNQNPGMPPPVAMPDPTQRQAAPPAASGGPPAEAMPTDGRDWVYVNTDPRYPAHRGWRLRENAQRDGMPVVYDPRQSSMNAGTPQPAPPAAAGVTSAPAAALPPQVAMRWQQMHGRPPTEQETDELQQAMAAMGVM